METLSSKEFFEQIKTNSLKQPLIIKGIAKDSEKDSEILFKVKNDSSHWIPLTSSMIEAVKIIKVFTKEGETMAVIKLLLKAPTTPEGKVLAELLTSFEKRTADNKEQSYSSGKEQHEHYCSCGCRHTQNCQCGCNSGHEGHYCSCGCHHTQNCQCGGSRLAYSCKK